MPAVYTANSAYIRTWNSGTTCATFEGGSTYIPGLMHTEVEVIGDTNTWGTDWGYNNITDGGTTNLNIRYADGAVLNTLAYQTTAASTTGITYRVLTAGTVATAPTVNIYYNYGTPGYLATPAKTLEQRIKELLRQRIAPPIYTHAKPLGFTKDLREIRARETLHRVLGDDRYKSFLKKGFISVIAKSGLIYQIFPGHDFTKVYNRGIMVDRYCVVLQGGFPPTDSLIMRYLMILNNEEQFKSYAIKHGAVQPHEIEMQDNRSLLEIFKEYKKAA